MSISLGNKLGEGAFGIVYEGIFEGKPTCALKAAKDLAKDKVVLLNEDYMLRYLHRDKEASVSHIITREGFITDSSDKKKTYLVLELLGMNLWNYYNSKEGLSLEKTRQITRQLAKALSFLDKNHVIHRDIKPENILVSADENFVKLADFGAASFSEPAYNPPNQAGQTLWYRSPEVILGITATGAIDSWSAAAVITEIYCNKVIFNPENNEAELVEHHRCRFVSSYPADLVEKGTAWGQEVFRRSLKIKGYSRPLSQVMQDVSTQKGDDSEQLMDLLRKMFIYDPEKRATPSEILNHPFLLQEEVIVSDENPQEEQEHKKQRIESVVPLDG